MANINLLPWREQLREERKRQFFTTLAIAAGLAALLLLAADRYMNNAIGNQRELNDYLTQQIAILDREIAEIRNIQQQKQELTARMSVIQDLQGTRPVIVRLFDELVRTLPEGVYFDNLSRTGDLISITGVAESNRHISALMRSLDDSEWFANSELRQVRAVPPAAVPAGASAAANNAFDLLVTITAAQGEVQ